jgi:hypothetical protein
MLARIFGKSNIYNFKIEIFGDVKSFDFLKVIHQDDGDVLAQVTNITRDGEKLIGDCRIIGFRDQGVLKNIRTPFENNVEITIADDDFIQKTIGLDTSGDAFIGILEHHPDLKVKLDLKKTITKHMAILAKSGAGKSYTVGVFLEEVLKKKIPIVILDPHNEYATIKYPNTNKKDIKRLEKFNLKPLGFLEQIKEYSPDIKVNPQAKPISLDINSLKPHDLILSLPQKLSPAQQSLIFNVLSNLNNRVNFDELIFTISNEESNAKWSLISALEQLKKLNIFSHNPTPLNNIVKYNQTSIISLKGVDPYVQEVFVSGLLKELYEARKKEEIPPFLLVLEEAHNFCPERSFGELKTSKIIRTIAGEGRKFGIGLCVISQRPAKVDKNVISQCSTQILLKMTNPNDLKSVISSSEGVDSSSEQELQKLNIGTCLLTGVIDIPIKVNIRPRQSKHGGETVDITLPYEVDNTINKKNQEKEKEIDFFDESNLKKQESDNYLENSSNNDNDNKKLEINKKLEEPKNNEYLQFVAPEIEREDALVLLETDKIKTNLVPGAIVKLEKDGKEINILFDRVNKYIIKTIFPFEGEKINENILNLQNSEEKILKEIIALNKKKFNPAELLLKTNTMFNEILRVCENLSKKGILKKIGREFELLNFEMFSNLENLNFYGEQKFEDVSYDEKETEKITLEDTKKLFEKLGVVKNIKDIFLLKYIAN